MKQFIVKAVTIQKYKNRYKFNTKNQK